MQNIALKMTQRKLMKLHQFIVVHPSFKKFTVWV